MNSVKVDGSNNIVIAGGTQSSDFPCFNPGNGAFIDSTLGGTIDDYLVFFSPSGLRSWATLIGGSGNEKVDGFGLNAFPSYKIAFDSHSNIFIVGSTESNDLLLKNDGGFFDSTYANHDGYIMKFDHGNFSQIWSTYISGDGHNEINSVAINSNDVLFCAGATSDSAFWLHQHPGLYFQDSLRGGYSLFNDGSVIAFDAAHHLIYGTYFGGYSLSQEGDFITSICIDNNSLYMTGYTTANSSTMGERFPLYDPANGAYFDSTFNNGSKDAFITQICISSVVGINELEISESGLITYPNPTSGNLTMQFDLKSNDKYKISVFNTYGSLIDQYLQRGISGKNKLELNSENYPAGIYYIEVNSDHEKMTGKFIKL